MKTARRTVLFFLAGLAPLLSSCTLFEEEKTPELPSEELVRIAAQKRLQNLQQRRILFVAICAPENTADLREAAKRNNWRIAYFSIDRDKAFAAIRNGKADIVAGKLTPAEIRAARLTPLMEYRVSGKPYAYAAWNGAEELENVLKNGTNPTNSNIPLEKSVLQE